MAHPYLWYPSIFVPKGLLVSALPLCLLHPSSPLLPSLLLPCQVKLPEGEFSVSAADDVGDMLEMSEEEVDPEAAK